MSLSWIQRLKARLGPRASYRRMSSMALLSTGGGIPIRQVELAPRGVEFVEDVSPARWVEDSLSEFGKVRSMLPEGFAAYTRVFHPAYLDSAGEEPMRWCVATDIDLFDTYVGGSSECIEAILSCKDLEALPTTLDARLDIGGDTINVPSGS